MAARTIRSILLGAAALLAVPACSGEKKAAPDAAEIAGAVDIAAESARLNEWFSARWLEELERSPEMRTFLGDKTDYDKLDDVSDEAREKDHQAMIANLAEMRAGFDPANLDASAKLSYRLFEYLAEQQIADWPYRDHWYVFSHFRGPHSSIPVFLANQHRIDDEADARAYIARLDAVKRQMGQYQQRAEAQFAAGVYPPKWSYERMIVTARNIVKGAPFDDSGEPSGMLADFSSKVDALDISAEAKTALIDDATRALTSSVKPAYDGVIDMMERQMAGAGDDDGAWKLPDGAAYYNANLRRMTTTDMSASAIHDLGLSEVARIHDEMRAIIDKVGFDGDLNAFFAYMRDDPDKRFTYPNDDDGRARYLTEATAIIDDMRSRLDEQFLTKPKAAIEVRRVEEFREKAAGKAFYQRPAPDGSRPGIYYANLNNMNDMPVYQMAALAYHEGIPGHHMQLAIMQELENVPEFRRFGGFTAYTEGWGLYSEYIPKAMGLYEDPYSDFGRLAMELWRAARLVVDTGLHDKRWTREEAVQYLLTNTPNPEGDCRNAIDRYVVMPGQATAYKIGMLKIMELRERAETALGEKFDVRRFHDAVLDQGALPLAILEEKIDAWIAAEKAG
ncbi:MAG: DUF885 family protein [Parvularculaceae bacterium]